MMPASDGQQHHDVRMDAADAEVEQDGLLDDDEHEDDQREPRPRPGRSRARTPQDDRHVAEVGEVGLAAAGRRSPGRRCRPV